jgi:membrane protease YdiL (CAAX protease family)
VISDSPPASDKPRPVSSVARTLRNIDRRVFGILLAGGLLGVLAILPLASEMVRTLPVAQAGPPMPMPLVFLLALAQNGLLLAVAIGVGMTLAPRVGLTMPVIEALARRTPAPSYGGTALRAVGLGAATGAAMIGIEAVLFARHLTPPLLDYFEIPLWKRLLAGIVYGGITEELLMRLFLLSLLASLLGRWWKTPEGRPAAGAMWTAIVLVALLFGLGHLPATSLMTPLTPPVVARAFVLNGVAGVAFGWLYWRRGLEAAMLGHMGTHLVLQPGAMLIARMVGGLG